MVSEEIDLDRAGVKGLDGVSGWDWRHDGEIQSGERERGDGGKRERWTGYSGGEKLVGR